MVHQISLQNVSPNIAHLLKTLLILLHARNTLPPVIQLPRKILGFTSVVFVP